jgi:DNA-binding NtrC family response regulator
VQRWSGRAREIIVCSDIESAELGTEWQPFTCVLSDVRLTSPFRFEGLEFIREVKEHSPQAVVVHAPLAGALNRRPVS